MTGRRRGWIFAALGMLFVSTDSFFVRWSESDTWTISFWVALFSLVSYVGLALATRESSPVAAFRFGRWALVAVSVIAALTQVLFVTAVTRTTVANVVVIVAATPILAAVIAHLFFGEPTSRRVWVAIAITFTGVLLIVGRSVGEPTLDGDLIAVFVVALFSLNINLWRRHPEMSRVVGLGTGASLVIVTSALAGATFAVDARMLLAAVGMGLVFNPIGRLLFANAPRHAPAGEVAMFTPVETVAATIWAWIAFSEAPGAWTVVGGIIVIAGMLLGTVGQMQRTVST